MDGLLIDSEPLHMRAFQRASAECGFHMPDSLHISLLGLNDLECAKYLQKAISPEFPFWKAFHLKQKYWREEISNHGVNLKFGALEILEKLDHLRIPKAIATSSVQTDALLALGNLAGRFNAIVTGDQIQHGKPAPDIFLKAAAKLYTHQSKILVFEDSLSGIEAARRARMDVCLIPDILKPKSLAKMKATYLRKDLKAAFDLIL